MKIFIILLAIVAMQAYTEEDPCSDFDFPPPESSLAGNGFSTPPVLLEIPDGWEEFEFQGRSIPIPVEFIDRIIAIEHADRVGSIYMLSDQNAAFWRLLNSNQISEFQDTGIQIERLLAMAIEGRFAEVNGIDECAVEAIANLTLDLHSRDSSKGAFLFDSDLVINEEKERWTYFWRNDREELIYASWSLPSEQLGILRRVGQHRRGQPSVIQELLTCAERSTFTECTHIESTEFEIDFRNEEFERVNYEQ